MINTVILRKRIKYKKSTIKLYRKTNFDYLW